MPFYVTSFVLLLLLLLSLSSSMVLSLLLLLLLLLVVVKLFTCPRLNQATGPFLDPPGKKILNINHKSDQNAKE